MLDEIEASLSPLSILDSMNDGIYVTDLERRILFWNKAAERILGWTEGDVLGLSCFENLLNHTDKHGRHLCHKETCPLYRSMVTGKKSRQPVLIYARTKTGRRIPLQVTVAPLYDKEGEVIGAVESFRDLSKSMADLQRAKVIQSQAMSGGPFRENELFCTVHYSPRDLVGGDFYAIERPRPGQAVIFLADVMGHGISSALYTMYLRSLWNEHHGLIDDPLRMIWVINDRLRGLLEHDYAYATAFLVTFDLNKNELSYVGAGHPAPFLFHQDGGVDYLRSMNSPIGLAETDRFELQTLPFNVGDTALLYTDGAIEAANDTEGELGEEGFLRLLKELQYPETHRSHTDIEEALLGYSSNITLSDDLTLIELRRSAG